MTTMKNLLFLFAALLVLVAPARPQNPSATRRINYGSADPSHCDPATGEVFINTSTTPPKLKLCTATDTWTVVGAGSVTSIDVTGGATGLTTSGGPVTSSGTIVFSGTLNLASGGTGATTAGAARTNLGLGTAATLNAPTSGNALTTQVVKGDDTRLMDARAPTAHASTHASAGSDPLTLSESQITGLTSDLAGKAASSHTHAESDVTGLVSDLAGKQPLDADLTALSALSSTGLLARTAADTYALRTITGTTNQVNVSNGSGVSGNPVLSLPQSIATTSTPTFAGIKTSGNSILGNTGTPNYPLVVGPDYGAGLSWAVMTVGRAGGSASILVHNGSTGFEVAYDNTNARAVLNAPGTTPIAFTQNGSNVRLLIDSSSNVQLGSSGLGTTAASGFPYVPAVGGAPTGAPAAVTGMAPMIVDTANSKVCFYLGGAWKCATLN